MEKQVRTFQHIWRDMDSARRRRAGEVVFAAAEFANEKRIAANLIATKLHLRPQKAAKLPPDKAASYLANFGSIDELIAGTLVRAYLFTDHVPMLAMFLDALGIPHEKGVISADTVAAPSADALRAAIEKIRGAFDAADVDLYLAALSASDPETWANLDAAQQPQPAA